MERNEYQKAFDALSFSPDFEARTEALLRLRASELEKERNMTTAHKTKKLAVLLAACIALLAVSVSAAVMMLSPGQVAEENQMPLLAEAFQSKDAIVLNETVESGNLAITLMGLVSGEGLNSLDPDLDEARTYAVLALRSLDGTPFDNESFHFSDYTLTPLVAGCSPAAVNNWTLEAGATGFALDGYYYFLLDTRSLEMFADHTVYMAFYQGGVPNNEIFTVHDGGDIAFCDDFTAPHALFTIPLDPAKADPAAVEAFLKRHDTGWTNDRTAPEAYDVDIQDTTDGQLVTIIPLLPQDGSPYSPEDFERDLVPRREAQQTMLDRGQITQEDYDEWEARQAKILAGLRDGSLSGLQDDRGGHYFNDVDPDGATLSDRLTGQSPTYATEAEFQAYMTETIAGLDCQLEEGAISQTAYDVCVKEMERILEGIREGTSVAALLPEGGMFVGTAPGDWIDYRLDEDGAIVGIMQTIDGTENP